MEKSDMKAIRKDIDALKKSVEKILVNMNKLEILKALLCHRPGPDPEGELTDWAKKELEEARRIPDTENVSLEELKNTILRR
ncbi:MAG: hypothetical protein JRI79_13525 [Deltaproteobacteria bacterium]|nr:hypothetical protein [Deltaproteobacteria bacterium]MBW1978965.1 hypothetical protein [Deltaproteobacteria bacterium]MBW2044469.1 hypothetical protein [Deltaproteobacteria bacterium]